MKEINEMNLAELKAFEEEIKGAIKVRKEAEKADKTATGNAKIEEVNAMIEAGTLRKGSAVIVTYKGNEVEGVIATEAKVDSDNITVHSDAFDGKYDDNGQKRRYIKKANFVKLA